MPALLVRIYVCHSLPHAQESIRTVEDPCLSLQDWITRAEQRSKGGPQQHTSDQQLPQSNCVPPQPQQQSDYTREQQPQQRSDQFREKVKPKRPKKRRIIPKSLSVPKQAHKKSGAPAQGPAKSCTTSVPSSTLSVRGKDLTEVLEDQQEKEQQDGGEQTPQRDDELSQQQRHHNHQQQNGEQQQHRQQQHKEPECHAAETLFYLNSPRQATPQVC